MDADRPLARRRLAVRRTPPFVRRSSFGECRALPGRLALGVSFVVALLFVLLLGDPSTAAAQGDDGEIVVDSLVVSCPGMGRVDITLLNLDDDDAIAVVRFDQIVRRVTVPADDSVVTTITGRPDGTRPLSVDGQEIEDVQIRCLSGYAINDQVATPSVFNFLNSAGTRSFALNSSGLRSSFEPGESAGCVHPAATGSQWYRGITPGSSLAFTSSGNATVGVYINTSPSAPGVIGDLRRLDCVEIADLPDVDVIPGTEVWLQVSGPPLTAIAIVASDVPVLTFTVDVECFAAGGLIETVVTNQSAADVLTTVGLLSFPGEIDRSRVLEPGESAVVRVGSRRDGRHIVSVNGGNSRQTWVECSPNTGPNDTIATAEDIDLVAGESVGVQVAAGTFGHDLRELDQPDCFKIEKGTAWFKVVAPADSLLISGFDDQWVGLFRSTVGNPTRLDQLIPLSCGEPERSPRARTVVGTSYWIAVSEDFGQEFRIQAVMAPVNDMLADARELDGYDEVPDAFARVQTGEPLDCFGPSIADSDFGTLWWKWTATDALFDPHLLSFDPQTEVGFQVGLDVAVYSSTQPNPTFGDLTENACLQSRDGVQTPVTPGQTYWLQVRPEGAGQTAISIDATDISLTVTASCLAGRGRIDVDVANASAFDLEGRVGIRGSTAYFQRDVVASAGEDGRVSVTGRSDGRYTVTVRLGTEVVRDSTATVACADITDPVAVDPVVLNQSCLAGNGRIDIDLNSQAAGLYRLELSGPVSTIIRNLTIQRDGTFTVTGRPDGSHRATVVRASDAVLIFDETFVIGCDAD